MTYVLSRAITALLTVVGTLLLVFILVRVLPGDPAVVLMGDYASSASPAQLEATRQRLGLDRSMPEQFARYVGAIVQGDLGESVRTRRPVAEEIRDNIGSTVALIIAGLGIALLIGVPAGVYAALHRNRAGDYIVITGSMLALASPSFWFAIVLIYLLSFRLGWFPIFGGGQGLDALRFLALPALVVGTRSAALIARMARSTMLDVLGQDYMRTARSKGLSNFVLLRRHALPNAALPILTIVGLDIAFLMSSAIVIESVFGRPGLGKLLVDAMVGRDYPVVQGAVLVFAVAVIVVNTFVDMLYRVVDPRFARA
jgi:peptide/nickel transport system permease protein